MEHNIVMIKMKGIVLFIVLGFIMAGCNAFMHGYTRDKAHVLPFYLVTGDKDNFGDRRIEYNRKYYNRTGIDHFLDCMGKPGFIYEYKTMSKCMGLQFFYPSMDSVFVFEQTKRGNLNPVLLQARKMDDFEKLVEARLKKEQIGLSGKKAA
jgi:hypothetical protein